jgi:hypothetical protein
MDVKSLGILFVWLTIGNFLWQVIHEQDWGVATERSWFQFVALLGVYIYQLS